MRSGGNESMDEHSVMTGRDTILSSIRRSLGVRGDETPRRAAVANRLNQHPAGVIPARGQGDREARCDLFRTMMEQAAGTVEEIASAADVPAAVSAFLRARNLPSSVRRGDDPRLAAMPWGRERTLEVTTGPSDGNQLVAVSHAFGGVAETGTLMLMSGPDNPTTLNFLPDTHIVVLSADDVAGDYETLWQRLREKFPGRTMPRTVNMITGPSRSADIEQTLILGAHGPRQLHVIVVRD
jgi:L-lactate dehydrogenase complex protein LldG